MDAAVPVDAGADQLPAPHEDQSPATHTTAESTALHGGAPPTVPFQRLSKAEKRARKAESLKERRMKKREHQKQGRKKRVESRREEHEGDCGEGHELAPRAIFFSQVPRALVAPCSPRSPPSARRRPRT